MNDYSNKRISEIDIIKKELFANGWQELEIPCGMFIKDAAKYLVESKTKGYYARIGQKWFADFNGKFFYSTEELTERGILTAFYGCSPEEYERKEQERHEKMKKEQEEFIQKIPQIICEYIEKGHKILSHEYYHKWDEIVPVRVNDIYRGLELQAALDVIEILNKENFEKAKQKFKEQNHSNMSYGITIALIKEFSKYGEKFAKMV